MFRAVYDVVLRGAPEELACLAKLGEYLFSRSVCVGTHTSFLCSYGGSVVKVTPQMVKPHYPAYELPQLASVRIIVESPNHDSLVAVVSDVYRTLKECGLIPRLLPE